MPVERFIVPAKGVGRPDYSGEISKIRRGELYPEFVSRALTEKYKIFYLTIMPSAPLAPGDTLHLLDVETALPMPWSHVAGFDSDFREWFFNVDSRLEFTATLDGIPIFLVPDTLAMVHEYERVVWFKASLIDPTCALPHTWDAWVTNVDTTPLVGTIQIAIVITLFEE